MAKENGCYICRPLWHLINATSDVLEEGQRVSTSYTRYSNGHVVLVSSTSGWTLTKNRFKVIPSQEIDTNLGIRYRNTDKAFQEGVTMCQKWMRNCLNTHSNCLGNTQCVHPPTRLLEIQESKIRLVVPDVGKWARPYVALSYCWGRKSSHRLVNSKHPDQPNDLLFDELQNGISLDELPKAFQEAIRFIKSLSTQQIPIKHIWIDALCIKQDSPEDWQEEAIKMERVYSNCIVCLALSRAENPEQDIFGECSPRAIPPFQVGKTAVSKGSNECIVVSNDYFKEALYRQPLGERAWPLQERLLPPRVISFGQGELFWDCFQCPNQSESFPNGVKALHLLHPVVSPKPLLRRLEPEELLYNWFEVISEYTDRDLTFPEKDKLLALSAITAQWETETKDECIVGHFWKMLPLSLVWRAHNPGRLPRVRERPTTRINTLVFDHRRNCTLQEVAPSWSWASVDGPLFINTRHALAHYQVMSTAKDWKLITYEDIELGKQISLVALTVEGFCAEIKWENGHAHLIKPGKWSDEIHALFLSIDDSSYVMAQGSKYWIIWLVRNNSYFVCEGLVLEQAGFDGQATMYRRIGLFQISEKYEPGRQDREWIIDSATFFDEQKKAITLI
ncbi:HET-domain-containing protein [Aspergillus sclerotiicarbonarius CBS 121057]|uniref:HET-domain-containing protein n=1 Tax=Aspergillus sclerotiicarbonarius (strain CBS 121057 / IBT 28362) TaxID=1448318 RepID=A0A319E925_ASPSB|nr:HET-domain-containing protein [Aspergillus sclerotiicarbonarius CBS 121057]